MKRPTVVSAFSDKDSHLGTTALLVSLLEVIFPQICAGPPRPLLRSVLERHLLGDQISWPTCWKWHPPASRWTHLPLSTITLPPPEIRALCHQPQALKREPHHSWPCSLLLVTLTPCLGWGWGQGTPWRRQEEVEGIGREDWKRLPLSGSGSQ